MYAFISCSRATAIERRSSALAWAMLLVGFGLVGLQARADVLADHHVGDVNGQDLKRRPGVQALREHRLGDRVGLFHHFQMRRGRADGGDDALADARQHRLLARAADELLDVGPHRHARERLHLDAVLGDPGDVGRLDDFGVDRHLHGFQHIAPGQVNRGGPLEGQGDLRPVRADQRLHHPVHIAARQVVRFQLVEVDGDARLDGGDQRQDDPVLRHAPQPHPDQAADGDAADARRARRDPQAKRHEPEDGRDNDQGENTDDDDEDRMIHPGDLFSEITAVK